VSTKLTRIGTSASLIAFAGMIGIGASALLPFADKPLIAKADVSEPPVIPCGPRAWLHINRDCLSRRGLPWTAGPDGPAVVPLEVVAAGNPTQQPSPAGQQAASLVEEPPKPSLQSTTQEAPPDQPAPAPSITEHSASQPPIQQTIIVDPVHETRAQPPTAVKHPKAAIEIPTRPLPAKKASRERRPRSTSIAADLKQGRKPGDKPREIPVSSYAADGSPRTVMIRPTSIQDSYFYSAPR
jgi:hypothetical protein